MFIQDVESTITSMFYCNLFNFIVDTFEKKYVITYG